MHVEILHQSENSKLTITNSVVTKALKMNVYKDYEVTSQVLQTYEPDLTLSKCATQWGIARVIALKT